MIARSPSRIPRYGRSKCLWRRCVDLATTCQCTIRCFLRRADNHRRHVSGRRSHAQLSLRNLLPMMFKSRCRHNMIPLSCQDSDARRCRRARSMHLGTLSNNLAFFISRNHDHASGRIRLFACASQVRKSGQIQTPHR